MEKKESPKKEDTIHIGPKFYGLPAKFFGIVKFILGICFLPFVYAASVSFLNEFYTVEETIQNYFWSGAISLLIIYLFVWEPAIIYSKGQRLLEIVFSFFKPLVKVAPYLLPVYTLILFIAYWLLSSLFKGLNNYFIFLFGFTTALHLIFSAKSIRSKKEDFLKANYIFGFSFIYMVNLLLLALFFSVIFEKFSFVNFCNNAFQAASSIFSIVFRQFFL